MPTIPPGAMEGVTLGLLVWFFAWGWALAVRTFVRAADGD